MSIDAMKQALEALEFFWDNGYRNIAMKQKATMDALRERLAQPEQEPVAFVQHTTPRQWQGLTDEEIENMMDYWSEPARSAYGGAHTANGEYVCIADIIRDAEAKLKEKNK